MKKFLYILVMLLALSFALTACGDGEVTVSVDKDGYVIVNGVKTEHKIHTTDEITVNNDGFVVVNGNVTDIVADKDDVITVDADGYVIVNGVKTEHKIHTTDEITVNNDGFVVVNGVVTDIVADKDDVITVGADGYLVVNGVKTEHEVKNKNHSFGAWKLYNEGETDCEKKLYHRICSECSTIEWKEGTYQDHQWTTVTTAPTCQAGGFDTKTCNACGKVEIGNETPVGEHTYLPDYSYDNSNHWLACQNCTNIKDKAEHTMDAEGVCTVCHQLVGDTEGVIYDISADKTHAMVIDYTGTATRVKIAAEYQGLPVTQIYENAFKEKTITAVIIPDSVTTIGAGAFAGCRRLTSVTIPDSVTTIGVDAFEYCSSLTSVTIPNSVTTIGYYAFRSCSSLTSVTIGNSVTTIGSGAFSNCTGLTSVTIGNGVTTIDYYVFSYCSSLTSVTIPNSVTTIGDSAFSYCSRLTSVTIGNGVTTISDSAFEYCSRLTSVTIGNGVTSISNSAFDNCNALQYAEYGNCKYLGSADNPYFALITVVNSNYSTYTIHEDTKIIADSAFSGCSRMTAITIPDSVTTIGDSAFSGCTGVTSVTIPDSVTTIGMYAFYYCSSLTEIHFAGTKEQWQAISKGSLWNYSTGNYTIHCTDGDIKK